MMTAKQRLMAVCGILSSIGCVLCIAYIFDDRKELMYAAAVVFAGVTVISSYVAYSMLKTKARD